MLIIVPDTFASQLILAPSIASSPFIIATLYSFAFETSASEIFSITSLLPVLASITFAKPTGVAPMLFDCSYNLSTSDAACPAGSRIAGSPHAESTTAA